MCQSVLGTIVLKFTGLVNRKVDNELNYNGVSFGGISLSASCAPYCELV